MQSDSPLNTAFRILDLTKYIKPHYNTDLFQPHKAFYMADNDFVMIDSIKILSEAVSKSIGYSGGGQK